MSSPAQRNIGSTSGEVESSYSKERSVRWVGKYRILSELGRGGMSSVYLAVARGPGGVNKLVVLKAVLPELASEPGALAMFLDEARLGAQLNHANVVQTYEVGTEGDRHVIVMEYLEGQTLAHLARRAEQSGAPISLAMHLRIIMSALEGLHYAHELSAYDGSPLLLVHRDISPQNVFITYGGQVKVLDFGIAKASSSSTQTATGVVKGKIAYMAPEQMIADDLDRRADVYSVGCMLWAAATGRKLWKDTPDVQIMRRVINGDIPTPQSVNVAVDDEFNQIVMIALAADPNERYQTALALQEALEAYCERFSTPIKQKEIGGFVSTLYADTRAELKAVVERQLALALNEEPSAESASEVRVFGTSPGWQPGRLLEPNANRAAARISPAAETQPASPSSSRSSALLGAAERSEPAAFYTRRRRLLFFISVPALLLLAISVAYAWTRRQNATNRELPAATVPGPPARSNTVSVRLSANPAEAKLYLDDLLLASNPATRELPTDGRVHRLRAQAPGYETTSTDFSPLRETQIEILLTRTVALPASGVALVPSGKVKLAGPSRSVRSAGSAAAKVDCQQPFYVDAEGIKKLRPECL